MLAQNIAVDARPLFHQVAWDAVFAPVILCAGATDQVSKFEIQKGTRSGQCLQGLAHTHCEASCTVGIGPVNREHMLQVSVTACDLVSLCTDAHGRQKLVYLIFPSVPEGLAVRTSQPDTPGQGFHAQTSNIPHPFGGRILSRSTALIDRWLGLSVRSGAWRLHIRHFYSSDGQAGNHLYSSFGSITYWHRCPAYGGSSMITPQDARHRP